MKKIVAILALATFLASCEKEIELKDEEKDPRIVVNGLFVAGDTIRIHLSESRNILYEGSLPNITTAIAQLLDANGNVLGNFVHEADGNYVLNGFTPVAGSTYRLSVSYADFTSVESSTYTPDIISVSAVDTLRKGDKMSYEIKFQDDPNVTNYYAVTINKIAIWEDEFTGEIYIWEDPYYTTTEIYTQNGSADADGSKWGNIFLFSDATFNGGICSFSAENYLDMDVDSSIIAIGLRSVSEDYFKYSVSLDKYYQTAGDPFAQPVQVYSNIDNGFGIFGAYSAFSDTLILN